MMLKRFGAPLLLIEIVGLLACSGLALAQTGTKPASPAAKKPKDSGGISISPSRVQLKMLPGSKKTFVVRVMHGTRQGKGKPARLLTSLNDWRVDESGRVKYFKPNTLARSAAPWVVFSPTEMSVPLGQTHAVRVTVTVPKDAKPGDHTTSLVIEPRPDSLKRMTNERQMVFRFRIASTIYVQVPPLRPKAALRGLEVTAADGHVIVTPTLHNSGNSLVRPRHAVVVTNSKGQPVIDQSFIDSMPVLAGSTLRVPMKIAKALPSGKYAVRYRIDFRDDRDTVEGRTSFTVR